MILKHNLLALFAIFCISTFSFSQTNTAAISVDKNIDFVRVYEQVVREGYGTPFIYEKLATAYYFKSEYEKAVSWFQKLYSEKHITDPQLAYQYSQALKAVAFASSKNPEKVVLMK